MIQLFRRKIGYANLESSTNLRANAKILSRGFRTLLPHLNCFRTTHLAGEIWGKWVVRRDLPTHMISCWGDEDARKLVGTEIEYSAELFRWKDVVTKNPIAVTTVITAQQFHDAYSGKGAGSSDVTFAEIGINCRASKRDKNFQAPRRTYK